MEDTMVNDKEMKLALLKQIMADMGDRVAESDLKPKTTMMIKASGDNPEDVKSKVIDKLSALDLPEDNMEEDDISSLLGSEKMKKLLLEKLKK